MHLALGKALKQTHAAPPPRCPNWVPAAPLRCNRTNASIRPKPRLAPRPDGDRSLLKPIAGAIVTWTIAACALAAVPASAADDWPARPVTVVCPFAPGI